MTNDESRRVRKAKQKADQRLVEDTMFDDSIGVSHVAARGYDWITRAVFDRENRKQVERRFLVAQSDEEAGLAYSPQDCPGLFKEFASIEPTEDGIKSFADQYGLLTFGCAAVNAATKLIGPQIGFGFYTRDFYPDADIVAGRHCESFELWRSEINLIRAWSSILRAIEKEEPPEFHDYEALAKSYGPISSPEELRLKRFQMALNFGLKICFPLIDWNSKRKKYVIRIAAPGLIGAVRWQLARAFMGEAQLRPCRNCGKPLEISKEAFRMDRQFCSPACKQQDHRNRVKKALRLNAAGKKPKAIAKKLNTTVNVILRWLEKYK